MSDIKFVCPNCRQHIQCDSANAGRKVACPTCKAALRIPRVAPDEKLSEAEVLALPPAKTQPLKPGSAGASSAGAGASARQEVRKSEPASRPSAKPEGGSRPKPVPAGAPAEGASSKPRLSIPMPKMNGTESAATTTKPSAATPTGGAAVPPVKADTDSVHCICPICQSELRVSISGAEGGSTPSPRSAELVRKGIAPGAQRGSAPEAGSAKPSRPASATNATAAAVSKSHAARPGGTMKPRLDYVLSGKPPSASDDETAAAPSKPKPEKRDQ